MMFLNDIPSGQWGDIGKAWGISWESALLGNINRTMAKNRVPMHQLWWCHESGGGNNVDS
jgi:hypothetical protein